MASQNNFETARHLVALRNSSDPLSYLKDLGADHNIQGSELRLVRAEVLLTLIRQFQGALITCGFPYPITFRPDGAFLEMGGILLECAHAGSYLKASGAAGPAPGQSFVDMLRRLRIDPAVSLDIGANVGEVSLSLAQAFPQARILAFEPSSENVRILKRNLAAQNFNTRGIQVIQCAVTDKEEVAAMRKGAGLLNQVVPATGAPDTEAVSCIPIDRIFELFEIDTADFVKIDIEGGEPKLRAGMTALAGRVRSYCIEFSQATPREDYMALAESLLARGYVCYQDGGPCLPDPDAIARCLDAVFLGGKLSVANLWFVLPA